MLIMRFAVVMNEAVGHQLHRGKPNSVNAELIDGSASLKLENQSAASEIRTTDYSDGDTINKFIGEFVSGSQVQEMVGVLDG